MDTISPLEWTRVFVLYGHLLASMLTIAGVLTADFGLITGRFQKRQLHSTVKSISLLLLILWITGLTIVGLDTGFAPSELMQRPKVLVKLLSASVLSVNGFVLHQICFPMLMSSGPIRMRQAMLLAVTGALSTMHWLLAAFIGMGKPLGSLPLVELIAAYLVLVSLTIIVALAACSWIRQRMMAWSVSSPAPEALQPPKTGFIQSAAFSDL